VLLLGSADGEAISLCNVQLPFCSPILELQNRYCVDFPASEDICEFGLSYALTLKISPFLEISLLLRKVFHIINHLKLH